MSIHNHTEIKLSGKESPSKELDDARQPPISPKRNTGFESQGDKEKAIVYLKGWRLHTLTVACDKPKKCAIPRDATDILAGYV